MQKSALGSILGGTVGLCNPTIPKCLINKGAKIKVLVACEFSGIVRDAFIKKGHDAWSCDLLPTEAEGNHIQGDVIPILTMGWDLLIAHPPCTDIAVSGAKHFYRKGPQQEVGLDFFRKCLDAPIPKICIENPVSIASTRICKPTQIIQPWMFGDPFQKTTCLWLRWLPKLEPTDVVSKGEFYTSPSGKKLPMWYTKTKSARVRSQTFPGIANAMADQWG